MRGSRKLFSIALGCVALSTIGAAALPAGQAAGSTSPSIAQQRAALLQQLAALAPAKDGAASALAQAEVAFAAVQAQVLAAQRQLATLNSQLLALNGEVKSDQATLAQAKQQLSAVTRQTYENTDTATWVAAVLSAANFSQAMARLSGTSHLAGQVADLGATLVAKQKQIASAQAQIAADQAATLALEQTLGQESNQLLMVVEARNAALQAATAPERAIEAQIANLDQQAAGPPPAGTNSGPCGNHFAYGQCTWYVATRRCIPWDGNADQWYYNAARYGYPEGHAPAVGAVVVFWPGGDGASSVGHVAYVEAVGPADGVPAGDFKLSEMNFNGWDRVNYRVLPDNSSGIQGFIYAK
ncbi:MAG: CHAP domain-containing protein [Candidatus Dormibacteria bacterium]